MHDPQPKQLLVTREFLDDIDPHMRRRFRVLGEDVARGLVAIWWNAEQVEI